MFRFLLRRLGMVMPTFLGITILAFALIHLIPGDPVEVMLGERGGDPAYLAAARHRLGLDLPLPVLFIKSGARRPGRFTGHSCQCAVGILRAFSGDGRTLAVRADIRACDWRTRG